MEIKSFNINEIIPAPYNPREQLKRTDKEYQNILHSIEKYELVVPPIVNEVTGHCVSGHQRLAVLKDLGHTTVDCVVVHIEDEMKEKGLCIALNKIKGQWDDTKLTDLLNSLNEAGAELGDMGFTEFELGYYINSDEEEEEQDDETPGSYDEPASEGETALSDIICKIAGYNVVMTREEYDAMINDIKMHHGFDKESICKELERRLCNG